MFISSFENTTRTYNISKEENLERLQESLKGDALAAVQRLLTLPECVREIVEQLRLLFGRPEQIIHQLICEAREMPPIQDEHLEGVIKFSLMSRSLCAAITSLGMHRHLENPEMLMQMVDKLSPALKMRWADHIGDDIDVDLTTFDDWLAVQARRFSRVA